MEKLTGFNELEEEILSFSLPCWRLSSPRGRWCFGAALLLYPSSLFWGWRKAHGLGRAVTVTEPHPELTDHFLAQAQWSNFCPRQKLISSGLPLQELSFKATSPTGCARIMLSAEISAQSVSLSQGTSAVHHCSPSVPKSEASFWESTI